MLLGFQLESPVPGEAFRLQQPADSGGEVLLHVEITDQKWIQASTARSP